ncbi:MAG: tRNA pseudouridine(38-40) synthase TruA [Lachnospiraceae bacterium]|nr:tRNA pseudouridine(38-40) synthase TruA [Lachnospiraceae bacterium]
MNYKIIVQYDGTRYNGWQKQKNTKDTIQGKLEVLLSKMTGYPVEVHGSGRTDAGVHALAQTANFHLKTKQEPAELLHYLNRYLPADISVTDVQSVSERFHSRLNAVSKTYRYRIGIGPVRNVFERSYIFHMEETPDVTRMREAAAYLIGEHDFMSFNSNQRTKKSTVRRIDSIEIRSCANEITIDFTGNGFLYNMVRILTGTLVEAGLGKRAPEEIPAILSAKNRQAAGITMPPCGLTLVEVRYF